MAKRRDTILVIAKGYRQIGSRQLAPSFMSGVLSKLCCNESIKPIVLSFDDTSDVEFREDLPNAEPRIVRLRASSTVKGTSRTGSDSESWSEWAKVPLTKDILYRTTTFARIGREVASLLPALSVVHWLEPLAPWNAAMNYFLKSRGVKSYMTIFSLHKRYPAHYALLRMTLAGLKKVVVTTAGLQQVISKDVGVPFRDTAHIPLGVDLELYKPCEDKPSAKRRLGISPDHKVFSWFGPIEPSTAGDFYSVLNAARHIHERFPASSSIFAFKNGIPPKVDPCGDWVRFYQDLHHIRDILSATDAVILPFSRPSWQKGLPLTIVEALASGVPVITTKRGGLDETITSGFNGLLAQDPEDVCQAALSLCEAEGKLDEMSRNARLVAERRFDLNTAAQAYVDLWNC
jgi:glycosyltransferase involved in cell wall biosynthesis